MYSNVKKEIGKYYKQFYKKIKENKKIFLTFDLDNDGFCSAKALYEFLRKIKIKPKIFISKKDSRKERIEDAIKNFLNSKYKLFISLDVGISQISEDLIKKMENSNKEFLFIDHHLYDYKRIKRVWIINPRFINKNIYISTSAVLYLILKRIYINKKILFFLYIGDYSDKSNFEELEKKVNEFFPNLKEKVDEYSKRLTAFLLLSKNIENFLKNASEKSFEDKKMIKAKETIDKEIEKEVKKVKIGRKLIFHIIKSKFKITPIVASVLVEKYGKVTLVGRIKDDKIVFSARSKKENLLEILERIKSEKDLKFQFGGHEKACGIEINKKDLNRFLNVFKRYL